MVQSPCWAVLFSTVSTWQAPHQRVSGRQVVSTTFGAAWDEVDVPRYIIFIHSLEISEIPYEGCRPGGLVIPGLGVLLLQMLQGPWRPWPEMTAAQPSSWEMLEGLGKQSTESLGRSRDCGVISQFTMEMVASRGTKIPKPVKINR